MASVITLCVLATPLTARAEEDLQLQTVEFQSEKTREQAFLGLKDYLLDSYKEFLSREEQYIDQIDDYELKEGKKLLLADENKRIEQLEGALDSYFKKLLEEDSIRQADLDTISSLIKPLTRNGALEILEGDRLLALHKSFLSLNKGTDFVEQYKLQEGGLYALLLDESIDLTREFYDLENDVLGTTDETFSAILQTLRANQMAHVRVEAALCFDESLRGIMKALLPDYDRRMGKIEEAYHGAKRVYLDKTLFMKQLMDLESELSDNLTPETQAFQKSLREYYDEILCKVLEDLETDRFDVADAIKLKALARALTLTGDLSGSTYAFGLTLDNTVDENMSQLSTATKVAYLSKRILPEREVFVLTEASFFQMSESERSYINYLAGDSDKNYFNESDSAYHGIIMELFKRAAKLNN